MKTEKQAWLWLAKKWDRPYQISRGEWAVMRTNGGNLGLCPCISKLHFEFEWIDESAYWRMKNTLTVLPFVRDNFKFPTTRHGARQRAAFCRKMARAC